jgi:hypothetical protein
MPFGVPTAGEAVPGEGVPCGVQTILPQHPELEVEQGIALAVQGHGEAPADAGGLFQRLHDN